MFLKRFLTVLILIIIAVKGVRSNLNKTLLIFAVTTEITDAYLVYLRSLRTYGLKVQNLMATGEKYIGHSLKINLLSKELENYKDRSDVIVLFTDAYDVVFTAGEEEIIRAFEVFNASIVFSAETNCAPAYNLASWYPETPTKYRFLNSGGFIGYAPDIYDLLPDEVPEHYDDQLFYTLAYINETVRETYGMALDINATLFQSLHDAADHVSFIYTDEDTKLRNHYTSTTPSIIHGNGNGKFFLHTLSSYLAKSWTISKGCLACAEGRIDLTNLKEDEYPKVCMAIYIERPTPFLKEKLNKIVHLSYPKKRIFLFVYNKLYIHKELVRQWLNDYADEYLDYNYILSSQDFNLTSNVLRKLTMATCLNVSSDVYFSIDSEVMIENPETLKLLVSYNRTVLAPVMTEPGTSRSTFWGATSDNEESNYVESFDYINIINNTRRGIWNVPQVWHIYVIWYPMLNNTMYEAAMQSVPAPPDKTISWITRITKNFSMFLYATNLDYYGHLTNMEVMNQDYVNSNLWQVTSNAKDWENRYLHPLFYAHRNGISISEMKCPDVFTFPLFTEEFCKEMIETVESFQENWSNGGNEDSRLYSGFESIPSVDIFMTQIGYQREWQQIVRKYLLPMAERVFKGFDSKVESVTGFVVRYEVNNGSFPEADPHFDSSTFSVNVALNRKDADYKGGGIDFLRYSCSMEDTPIGWALIYPGRLTHSHRIRPITKGIKYNIYSFVDS